MNELISVIVPIYNVENYLPKCLDSIINQTYRNLEIILINDGSIDNSGNICEQYAKNDNRIILIHKSNGGLSDARNKGLDIAKGNYISFIDSDDFIHINFFQILYDEISKKNDLVISQFQKFSKYEEIIPPKESYFTERLNGPNILSNLYKQKYHDDLIIVCNKLFKKSLWIDLRFPQNKYHEDEFVCHHILYNSNNISIISEKLYYYYQRPNSITNNKKIIHQKALNYSEALNSRIKFGQENQIYKLSEDSFLAKKRWFMVNYSLFPKQIKKIIKTEISYDRLIFNDQSLKDKILTFLILYFSNIFLGTRILIKTKRLIFGKK